MSLYMKYGMERAVPCGISVLTSMKSLLFSQIPVENITDRLAPNDMVFALVEAHGLTCRCR